MNSLLFLVSWFGLWLAVDVVRMVRVVVVVVWGRSPATPAHVLVARHARVEEGGRRDRRVRWVGHKLMHWFYL